MDCAQHQNHGGHQHGPGCGHTAVQHVGHTDYLHGGHLHNVHADHVDDHRLAVSSANPDTCSTGHDCGAHDRAHRHGPACGHEPIPHGDHTDYLISGHLHHEHGDHCDDHGRVTEA
ncbi:MAG TPA: hypothetical protein VHG72_08450 [Polyangia bacterium]|nr:hypothetical protein [Polyangia bacterium]